MHIQWMSGVLGLCTGKGMFDKPQKCPAYCMCLQLRTKISCTEEILSGQVLIALQAMIVGKACGSYPMPCGSYPMPFPDPLDFSSTKTPGYNCLCGTK